MCAGALYACLCGCVCVCVEQQHYTHNRHTAHTLPIGMSYVGSRVQNRSGVHRDRGTAAVAAGTAQRQRAHLHRVEPSADVWYVGDFAPLRETRVGTADGQRAIALTPLVHAHGPDVVALARVDEAGKHVLLRPHCEAHHAVDLFKLEKGEKGRRWMRQERSVRHILQV